MENRAKFNLKHSIDVWKTELSQNSNMTRDNINELESHLQDEIQELVKLGLSNAESLLIAKNRIGNIKNLTTEYSKVNNEVYFKNTITPYLKGILFFLTYISIAELLTHSSILIAYKIGLNEGYLNLITIELLILLTCILLIFFYKKYKHGNFNMRKLTNIPVLVSTIIVSKFLIYLNLDITYSIKFSIMQNNLYAYKILFGLFILGISCIIYYSSSRKHKIKIVK